jgi:hypothetical protein
MEAVVTAAQVCFLLLALWLVWGALNHAVILAFCVVDQKPIVGRFIWLMLITSGVVACLYGAGVL